MTFTTTNSRLHITAIAIAAVAFVALHGTMLMGFDQLASQGQQGTTAVTQLAKTQASPRTVTLDTVVISRRRA